MTIEEEDFIEMRHLAPGQDPENPEEGVENELAVMTSSGDRPFSCLDSEMGDRHLLASRDNAACIDSLNIYCRGIRKGLLSREEEVSLAKKIETAQINTLRLLSLTPISSILLKNLRAELQPLSPSRNILLPRDPEDRRETNCQVTPPARSGCRESQIERILHRISVLEFMYRSLKLQYEPGGRRDDRPSERAAEIRRCRNGVFKAFARIDLTEGQVNYLIGGLRDVLSVMEPNQEAGGSSPVTTGNPLKVVSRQQVRMILGAGCLTDARELRGILDRIRIQREESDRAKEEFVGANLRLVLSIARRYSYPGVDLLDLVQEGNIGMMRAVDKFDYHLGLKFSTYASWWIRQSITRAIADKGSTIRKPVHIAGGMNRVRKAANELTHRMGRRPSLQELSERLQIPAPKVNLILNAVQEPISLDEAICDNTDVVLGNLIADENAVSPADGALRYHLHLITEAALQTLTPREREVICMRFGLHEMSKEYTLQEVAEALSVSRERVRQIEGKALSKLRSPRRYRKLHEFAHYTPPSSCAKSQGSAN